TRLCFEGLRRRSGRRRTSFRAAPVERGRAMTSVQPVVEEKPGGTRKHWDAVKRHSRTFRCKCGNTVFFRNLQCLRCLAPLGYLPSESRLAALEPHPRPGTFRADGVAKPVKACANRDLPATCNWLVASDDPNPLCIACRLNRTIPNLKD